MSKLFLLINVHLNELEILSQGCFLPSLVDIGLMVMEKKMKMQRINNDDDNNDIQRTKWVNCFFFIN